MTVILIIYLVGFLYHICEFKYEFSSYSTREGYKTMMVFYGVLWPLLALYDLIQRLRGN